jgi:hypothetical protein
MKLKTHWLLSKSRLPRPPKYFILSMAFLSKFMSSTPSKSSAACGASLAVSTWIKK